MEALMRPRDIIIIAFLISALLVSLALPLLANESNVYFKLPVKKLLAEPKEDAHMLYEFPIDVRMLGVTEDLNWFKLSVEFDLLFLGHYKYTGWVHAPLGDILRESDQ
jgi:hypothetical protein